MVLAANTLLKGIKTIDKTHLNQVVINKYQTHLKQTDHEKDHWNSLIVLLYSQLNRGNCRAAGHHPQANSKTHD